MLDVRYATISARRSPNTADAHILEDIARAAAERATAKGWELRPDGLWFRAHPLGHSGRVQGWKLHVSATPLSAPIVLARVAPILIEHRCAFKFARTLDQVFELVSIRAPRGSGGKFITVYPDDDDHLRTLAPLLDEATYDLRGPAVLSDRPLRPGSLVFYRYGAFRGVQVLTNDGGYDTQLDGPDGRPAKDYRHAWFSPPPWAIRPFPEDPDSATARQQPERVLLAGRFEVRAAIQHANKGGVYRALDRLTGATVVIKQARAHVGSMLCGLDSRDVLRHEGNMLTQLADDGLAPRLISMFEAGDSIFLAEELIEGQTLEQWTFDRLGRHADRGIEPGDARLAAGLVIDLVARVHARGLVLRDLKPANVMMAAGGGLRLIDPEYMALPGTPSIMAKTPGYCAPEQQSETRWFAPAPDQSVDLYALGGTLFFVATGAHPYFVADSEPHRPTAERLNALIDKAAKHNKGLRCLRPLISGLMQDQPRDRWNLASARSFIDRWPAPRDEGPVWPASASVTENSGRTLRDGIRYLCEDADFTAESGPWASGGFGATTDRCSVQHGTAGVLAVLTRAAQLGDEQVLETVGRTARRLACDIAELPRILPGLLFGSSGTAVVLHAAASLLGDAKLTDQAIGLALRIPLEWPNPDVCHGLAGAGLGQLMMWQNSDDPRFEVRVRRCADRLAAVAQRVKDGVYWPIPEDFDSILAGRAQPGFGHGLSGVATFLLAAGLETGVDEYIELAIEAGRTLLTAADVDEDGLVLWPGNRGDDPGKFSYMRMHWCNGVSGIGAFLLRLWQATGDGQIGTLARQAAATVLANRWQHSPVLCHGLAGSGEFLLDLHQADPDGGYLAGAESIAEAMLARDVRRDGHLLLADESLMRVAADYGTGLAGALGFLLRLRSGAPRLLLPVDRPRREVITNGSRHRRPADAPGAGECGT